MVAGGRDDRGSDTGNAGENAGPPRLERVCHEVPCPEGAGVGSGEALLVANVQSKNKGSMRPVSEIEAQAKNRPLTIDGATAEDEIT